MDDIYNQIQSDTFIHPEMDPFAFRSTDQPKPIQHLNKMTISSQFKIHYNHKLSKLIVFIAFLTAANCELLAKPENTWAKIGEIVILQCKSSLHYRLNWQIKAPKSSVELLIFNGYRLNRNVKSYCEVINGEPGKYQLNLTATIEAAQKYVCQEPGTLMKASADLIIIETDPECNVTKNGELTLLTCHILLHGNWAPVMECRNGNSGEVIGEQVYMYNMSVPAEGLTSRMFLPTNESQDPKMFYMCTTKFRLQEKPSDTTADNTPLYIHVWNYTMPTEPYRGDVGIATEASEATGNTYAVEKEAPVISEVLIVTFVVGAIIVLGIVLILRLLYLRQKNISNKGSERCYPFDLPKPDIAGETTEALILKTQIAYIVNC